MLMMFPMIVGNDGTDSVFQMLVASAVSVRPVVCGLMPVGGSVCASAAAGASVSPIVSSKVVMSVFIRCVYNSIFLVRAEGGFFVLLTLRDVRDTEQVERRQHVVITCSCVQSVVSPARRVG